MKRNTWQREAVRTALNERGDFISAQKLHSELKAEGSTIGLATVYRALTPDGENLYRACSSDGHHHHLICRQCGHTEEIEAEAVESWAAKVAAEHGFTQPRHVVDVFGLCQNCS
jgi:Fur family ferric uptake transcriptional regulator